MISMQSSVVTQVAYYLVYFLNKYFSFALLLKRVDKFQYPAEWLQFWFIPDWLADILNSISYHVDLFALGVSQYHKQIDSGLSL